MQDVINRRSSLKAQTDNRSYKRRIAISPSRSSLSPSSSLLSTGALVHDRSFERAFCAHKGLIFNSWREAPPPPPPHAREKDRETGRDGKRPRLADRASLAYTSACAPGLRVFAACFMLLPRFLYRKYAREGGRTPRAVIDCN